MYNARQVYNLMRREMEESAFGRNPFHLNIRYFGQWDAKNDIYRNNMEE